MAINIMYCMNHGPYRGMSMGSSLLAEYRRIDFVPIIRFLTCASLYRGLQSRGPICGRQTYHTAKPDREDQHSSAKPTKDELVGLVKSSVVFCHRHRARNEARVASPAFTAAVIDEAAPGMKKLTI